ncbi:MAG: hypothetical protein NC820_00185 [Candidatus Omnitrophica bacterium]|nr:hypothetical protein [Candidatus Omnitrophota bacterium]
MICSTRIRVYNFVKISEAIIFLNANNKRAMVFREMFTVVENMEHRVVDLVGVKTLYF